MSQLRHSSFRRDGCPTCVVVISRFIHDGKPPEREPLLRTEDVGLLTPAI
jgi:hypothetical protein